MAKETYYFSHDCNARNDEKLIAVRMRHGAEGYGIYFMILERLMESTNYMSVKDYNIIAFDLRVDTSKIKSIIEDFGLFVFTEDGKYFYSESFNRRMVPLDNLREQRKLAGKKSAEKRAKVIKDSTTVERPLGENPTKESKVKENNSLFHTCAGTCARDDLENILEKSLDECFNELKNNQSWAEIVTMNIRASGYKDFIPPDFYDYLKKFFMKLQNEGETKKSPKDAMIYFSRWLNVELEKQKKDGKQNSKRDRRSDIIATAASGKDFFTGERVDSDPAKLTEWINGLPIGR